VETLFEEGDDQMNYQDYIELGLNGDEPLKIILRGHIEKLEDDKVGVVSIVYATTDKAKAKKIIEELNDNKKSPNDYYMLYSVALDTDLTTLEHYPSIVITKDDLL